MCHCRPPGTAMLQRWCVSVARSWLCREDEDAYVRSRHNPCRNVDFLPPSHRPLGSATPKATQAWPSLDQQLAGGGSGSDGGSRGPVATQQKEKQLTKAWTRLATYPGTCVTATATAPAQVPTYGFAFQAMDGTAEGEKRDGSLQQHGPGEHAASCTDRPRSLASSSHCMARGGIVLPA